MVSPVIQNAARRVVIAGQLLHWSYDVSAMVVAALMANPADRLQRMKKKEPATAGYAMPAAAEATTGPMAAPTRCAGPPG